MEQKFFETFRQEILCAKKIDGVLISSPANMRACSGFCGEGIVFLSEGQRLIFTDARYTEAAKTECPDFEIIRFQGNLNLYENWLDVLKERMKTELASGIAIGFEDEYMTVQSYHTIEALLKKKELNISLIPLHKCLSSLRQVKTYDEIRKIEQAEKIGDEAFAKVIGQIRECCQRGETLTEKQIAAFIEFTMRELGAEGMSFDTIVASGLHSSMPHAVPTDKALMDGDFVTMDFGCKVNGYCSDMTRTVVIGTADDRQREIYDVVLRAQEAALQMIRPGLKGCEVDEAARKVIREAGYGEYFGHSLGHSVGLEIHETPCFAKRDENVLQPGMVITVEPGIYVEGFGGVRIEDVVVITENGCRNLTHSPKQLIEIKADPYNEN